MNHTPPIWIGGNSGGRPVTASPTTGMAGVRSPRRPDWRRRRAPTPLDSNEKLAEGIDDLRRRLDAAGRDPAIVDVTFSNLAGGTPGDDAFNPDAYLAGLDELAKLGVTWVQVAVPGDSLTRSVEALDQFRTQVIEPFSR